MQADETSESGGEAMDVAPPSEEPQADACCPAEVAQVGWHMHLKCTFTLLGNFNYLTSVAFPNDHALIRVASAGRSMPLCHERLFETRED
jgi:hypothetical protein